MAGTGHDAEAVVRAALAAGFVIRSGAYTSPRFGERFVCITTTVPETDMARFCDALPGIIAGLGRSA